MAGEDYTSPITGLTYKVPKYEEPADAPVAFKDFADSIPEGRVEPAELLSDKEGQQLKVASSDGKLHMGFWIATQVPSNSEGNIGDVVFVVGA